jgi:hypothetical protein
MQCSNEFLNLWPANLVFPPFRLKINNFKSKSVFIDDSVYPCI